MAWLLILVGVIFTSNVVAMPDTLKTLVINPDSKPEAVVIWLHGLGADGHDFEPIVPELTLPKSASVKFVFPHAPKMPVSINDGLVMPAWYDIASMDLSKAQDSEGIRRSAAQINQLIEVERNAGVAAQNIILAGFSQGGAIVLQAGLRFPERLGGIMVLSSYLPLAETLASEKNSVNQDVPIFYAHGVQDDVVPLTLAEHARDQLREQGYQVEWHTYTMPHAVVPEEIEEISRWLRKILVGDTED